MRHKVTRKKSRQSAQDGEATKSIRHLLFSGIFFSFSMFSFLLLLLCMLLLSRNWITIVMNLRLHRCQWLVYFLFLFHSLCYFCRCMNICGRQPTLCIGIRLNVALGECTFAHWLPVRVPCASNTHTHTNDTQRSWSDSTVSCCRMICDWWLHSWWIVGCSMHRFLNRHTFYVLDTNTNHHLELHNRNAFAKLWKAERKKRGVWKT